MNDRIAPPTPSVQTDHGLQKAIREAAFEVAERAIRRYPEHGRLAIDHAVLLGRRCGITEGPLRGRGRDVAQMAGRYVSLAYLG